MSKFSGREGKIYDDFWGTSINHIICKITTLNCVDLYYSNTGENDEFCDDSSSNDKIKNSNGDNQNENSLVVDSAATHYVSRLLKDFLYVAANANVSVCADRNKNLILSCAELIDQGFASRPFGRWCAREHRAYGGGAQKIECPNWGKRKSRNSRSLQANSIVFSPSDMHFASPISHCVRECNGHSFCDSFLFREESQNHGESQHQFTCIFVGEYLPQEHVRSLSSFQQHCAEEEENTGISKPQEELEQSEEDGKEKKEKQIERNGKQND